MLEALTAALIEITSGQHLIYLLAGVVMGLAVGIFPGLGGIVGLSSLLPFLFGMDPTSALSMLVGLVAVIPTSDTFTSVLMGIPGSSASQATVLARFPLAKKGEGARALGAAFFASLFGGLIGAVILTFVIVIARDVIILFTSAELFMLTILGLSMVGVLAGGNMAKGLLACGLGLMFDALGGAPATGDFRMTLGNSCLGDGLRLVVIGLAMFAVPEIIDLLRVGGSILRSQTLGQEWVRGLKDMWAYKWLCVRCAGIGCLIGALSGLGGSVVDWIAYGHVKQTSKDKSQFGKGDIRGVLAPEIANNAKEGGDLIPTLPRAVYGRGAAQPYLCDHLVACAGKRCRRGGMPFSVQVRRDVDHHSLHVSGAVHDHVICFAAFQAQRDLGDLITLFVVGLLGILPKGFGWPRSAFLIGFVLADQSETYLYQSVQFYDWDFLLRPGVLIIAAITLVSAWVGARKAPTDEIDAEAAVALKANNMRPQAWFATAVFVFFASGLIDGLGHSFFCGSNPKHPRYGSRR
jgi:putative tricarboxylic transport membrane protein